MGVKHHIKNHDPITTQSQRNHNPIKLKTHQKYSKVVFFGIKTAYSPIETGASSS